jgi:hypothetical protein
LRSKELLLWLIFKVREGDDLVIIDIPYYMGEMGIESTQTVKKAIEGLIDAHIIAKTNVKGVFYINALHFFKGSRISKWPKQSVIWHEKRRWKEQEGDKQAESGTETE